MKIDELYGAVDAVVRGKQYSLSTALEKALSSPLVRTLIEWELPRIDDLSDLVCVDGGSVKAIRYDSLSGQIGLKKPVVAGLLVRHAITRGSGSETVAGLIDGGNVNTGLALGHFAKRFELKAKLVLSRFFPEDVRVFIENRSEGTVETITSPSSKHGREREFYSYLMHLVRVRRFKKFQPLWHAKHGGEVLRRLGEEIAENITERPDYIVLSVGAGATLEGMALPIRKRFSNFPKIVAVEHIACPLIDVGAKRIFNVSARLPDGLPTAWLREAPEGIPHSVLGPHYDELNPFIQDSVIQNIDAVARFSEVQWRQMASFCRRRGLSVGNSSAVNLLVARSLAASGRSILTFVYEPFRDYYFSRQSESADQSFDLGGSILEDRLAKLTFG